MSAEAGLGGLLIAKSGVFIAFISAIAAGFGIMIAWPTTPKEAFYRFSFAFGGSFFLGLPLALIGWHQWPWMFTDSIKLSVHFLPHLGWGITTPEAQFVGIIFAATPFLFAGALLSWWVTRAIVLWFERRKDKDAVELLADGAKTWKDMRP